MRRKDMIDVELESLQDGLFDHEDGGLTDHQLEKVEELIRELTGRPKPPSVKTHNIREE